MKRVDTRGLACPEPVILTKKALNDENHVVTMLDSDTARENLLKLGKSLGCEMALKDCGGYLEISFFKGDKPEDLSVENNDPLTTKNIAYVFNKSTMGDKSEKLGSILIKSLIYTLSQMDQTPQSLVFYNEGVKLTCSKSEVLDDLRLLISKGTRIVSCGTCLNFFELSDDLKVGEVSNMYEIVEIMESSEKTITI